MKISLHRRQFFAFDQKLVKRFVFLGHVIDDVELAQRPLHAIHHDRIRLVGQPLKEFGPTQQQFPAERLPLRIGVDLPQDLAPAPVRLGQPVLAETEEVRGHRE